LAALFERMRGLCQQVAPHAALPLLIAQTNRLQSMASLAGGGSLQLLQSFCAHYALYVGKMFQEAGDITAASHWTKVAASWAARSGDTGITASILIRQAMLALYNGDGEKTILLARMAGSTPGSPDRIRGVALLREALGHARLRDEKACSRALDNAAEMLNQRDKPPVHLAPLEASNVADHHAITAAWCRFDLGYPAQSAELLDRQLAKVPVAASRTHARFGARMALACATAGEVDRACSMTWRLLPAIEDTASATVRIDLRRLVRVLSQRHRDPAVRALLPELNAVLCPSQPRG